MALILSDELPRQSVYLGSPVFKGASAAFSSTIPNTENPVSFGGLMTNGGTTGLDWQDVQSTGGTPGILFMTGTSSVGAFNDNIAMMQGVYSPTKHYSQIKFKMAGGYTPPSSHEVGIYSGFTITPHNAAGYEMNWGWQQGVQPVRWNGALGDFVTNVFTTLSGATFGVNDGDIARVIFDSSSGSPVLTLQLWNGSSFVTQWVITDTTAGKITSGNPGMGFFAHSGTGFVSTNYCAQGYACGNG